MLDISQAAARWGVSQVTLARTLIAHGWDFSSLNMTDALAVEFVNKTVDSVAEKIAEAQAKRIEVLTKAETARLNAQTATARANPEFACTRCDGKGKIRGFGHIDGGKCFACSGAGVRFPRQQRRA